MPFNDFVGHKQRYSFLASLRLDNPPLFYPRSPHKKSPRQVLAPVAGFAIESVPTVDKQGS
jgi:hypothetical protein